MPFFKSYFLFTTVSVIVILLICITAVASTNQYSFETPRTSYAKLFINNEFPWPTPGYTIITSPFGRRNAPTAGASSFHSGIDIGAPTGTNIISICSGEVTFLGFSGAGGYTITVKGDTFSASYCHVSPEFKVHIGQKIRTGQVIGKVGPTNVYGVPDNPYRDEEGNPTNRCNNWTTSSSDS